MKLSINWLSSYFAVSPDWDEVLHKLTMAGIEVENIEATNEDKIVEFKITPNRGDVLSVRGLLREISVLTDHTPTGVGEDISFVPVISNNLILDIQASEACPNYLTLVVKNINTSLAASEGSLAVQYAAFLQISS